MTRKRISAKARKRQPTVPYRLVMLEWEDSAQPVDQWQWIDDYKVPEIITCVSVGFIIAETKAAIALAPNLGDIGRKRIQASGILRVPRSAVRCLTEL
jgi:hypothetical protein